ncbi:hypothetical protein ACLNGM_02270 [Aureimonas phyllosphaerae]|uniref:hypothetical protein n=1 Tax=Aureimonas phyllosphaerae TaxID=1166078 RepID=UPI003A5BF3DE
MTQPLLLTAIQRQAIRVLVENTDTVSPSISSRDLEDDLLVAIFDLVRMGLAIERVEGGEAMFFRANQSAIS